MKKKITCNKKNTNVGDIVYCYRDKWAREPLKVKYILDWCGKKSDQFILSPRLKDCGYIIGPSFDEDEHSHDFLSPYEMNSCYHSIDE